MVWLTNLTGLALTILSVYCLYQARKAIRARFSIPVSEGEGRKACRGEGLAAWSARAKLSVGS